MRDNGISMLMEYVLIPFGVIIYTWRAAWKFRRLAMKVYSWDHHWTKSRFFPLPSGNQITSGMWTDLFIRIHGWQAWVEAEIMVTNILSNPFKNESLAWIIRSNSEGVSSGGYLIPGENTWFGDCLWPHISSGKDQRFALLFVHTVVPIIYGRVSCWIIFTVRNSIVAAKIPHSASRNSIM